MKMYRLRRDQAVRQMGGDKRYKFPQFIMDKYQKSEKAVDYLEPSLLNLISEQKGRIGQEFAPLPTENTEGAEKEIRDGFNEHWTKLSAEAGQ